MNLFLQLVLTQAAFRQNRSHNICSFFCFLLHFINPLWEIRAALTGYGYISRKSSAIPTYTIACWICSCFRNPLNSDMDYRIFNVRTRGHSCACVRIYTRGVGHPKTEPAKHFSLGKTHSVFLVLLTSGLEPKKLGSAMLWLIAFPLGKASPNFPRSSTGTRKLSHVLRLWLVSAPASLGSVL